MAIFKCVLIGEGGVGKTTFVNKAKNGEFIKKYVPTIGVDISPIDYEDATFNIWECSGQEKFGCRDRYFAGADCAIIMFDVNSKLSLKTAIKFYRDFKRTCGNDKPIVFVGNKMDCATKSGYERIEEIPRLLLYSAKTSPPELILSELYSLMK